MSPDSQNDIFLSTKKTFLKATSRTVSSTDNYFEKFCSSVVMLPGWLIFIICSHILSHSRTCCLIWIKKARAKDKTYIWVSVRWKSKNEIWEIYTPHIHWVDRGTGTPKGGDKVNRRDVSECDGWVCVLEVISTPSILSVIRKSASLTRVLPTFSLWVVKNTERWKWNSPPVDYANWPP